MMCYYVYAAKNDEVEWAFSKRRNKNDYTGGGGENRIGFKRGLLDAG